MKTIETWFLWLMIYSVIGWVYESTICSIGQRKLINRGFLNGPYCPIYGTGAVLVLLVLGAVLIALGANLLVDNGTLIAQALGVPESVIALTFVALGTSLPELVTAITSLAKGHGALSLGNVIGANVFNLVLVSGVSVTLAPFSIPQNSTIAGMNASLVMDIPVMFAVMLLLTLPALIKGKLSRPQGIALLCIYAAFCAVQFSI